jgi:hypothetical protein
MCAKQLRKYHIFVTVILGIILRDSLDTILRNWNGLEKARHQSTHSPLRRGIHRSSGSSRWANTAREAARMEALATGSQLHLDVDIQ